MKCPACASEATKVIDSRLNGSGVAIRRRRECDGCQFRFSTIEETHILDVAVLKRDGRRETYSREKLARGLAKAFEKRAISRDDLERLLHIIERDIQLLRRTEVSSAELGELVMKRLKKVDEVAYIRFASVYQGFKDAASFHRAIDQLARKGAVRQRAKNASVRARKTKKPSATKSTRRPRRR